MAGKVDEWTIRMKEEISGDATKAAKALEDLRDTMRSDRDELAELQRQMRELKTSGGDVKQAMQQLKAKIDEKRVSLKAAQERYKSLSEESKTMKARSQALTSVFRELKTQLAQMPGPIGAAFRALADGASKVASARAVSLGLGLAFIGVAGGAALAAAKLADVAINAADARRNEMLHIEALTKQRNMWGILPGKADDIMAAVDRVSGSVSISREKVVGYATQLYQAGTRGDVLATALEGASIKASALGDAAGSSFASWAGAVAMTGGNVKRLSEDVKNRFGGVVAQKMKSLEVQQLKMREGFASIFSGLHIDAFLTAMQRIRNLFNQSEASGRALKTIVSVLLTPIIGSATDGANALRRFFKQVIIGVLQLQLRFFDLRDAWRSVFGKGLQSETWSRLFKVLLDGRTVVWGLAAAVGVLAFNFLLTAAPVLLAGAAIWGLVTIVQQAWDFFTEVDWGYVGTSIVDGLIGGISAAWGKLKAFTAERIKDWVFAFKTVLGIASPSKVFAELGEAIPDGVRVGVQAGAPEARKAVDGLIATPSAAGSTGDASAPAPAQTPAPTRPGSSTTAVTIGEIHVHAKTDDARGLAEAFRRELENVLEGAARQLGAAEPA